MHLRCDLAEKQCQNHSDQCNPPDACSSIGELASKQDNRVGSCMVLQDKLPVMADRELKGIPGHGRLQMPAWCSFSTLRIERLLHLDCGDTDRQYVL